MDEIGHAVHYTAVPAGATLYGSDGERAGTVEVMLDNYREHIFDGVIFKGLDGRTLFADAPEVEHTAERGVVLRITAEEAQRLGPPEKGHAKFRPDRHAGRLGRLLGRGWRRQ